MYLKRVLLQKGTDIEDHPALQKIRFLRNFNISIYFWVTPISVSVTSLLNLILLFSCFRKCEYICKITKIQSLKVQARIRLMSMECTNYVVSNVRFDCFLRIGVGSPITVSVDMDDGTTFPLPVPGTMYCIADLSGIWI